MPEKLKKIKAPDLKRMKKRGEKIAMLTAYDATMARLLDRAGIDVILVGDTVGMVVLGYDTTVPVTLDDILHHTKAVTRGVSRPLVVADMPFLTYKITVPEAVRNAGRLIQEGGASAVKVEGGEPVIDVVRRLVDVGIPVMGHLGLQPQSIHQIGGYRRQARDEEAAERLISDARELEKAGAFAIVLESIPKGVAREVTAQLRIPTIGIGAGPHCDGQVLVSYDAFGLYEEFVPPFVKQYAKLAGQIVAAASEYAEEVRQGKFPAQDGPVPISTARDKST